MTFKAPTGADSKDILKNLKKTITKKNSLTILKKMYLARFLDQKMEKLVKQNKGSSFYISNCGHELVGIVASEYFVPKKDWALPYYRDRSFAIGYGVDLVDIIGAFLSREVSHHSGGRMMLDHFSHKEMKIPCQSSVVGSQYLQAAGVAKGIALRNSDEIVYVSGGEGSTSQGDFHETLNFASIHKLPLVIVIQDNGWAISTTRKEQTAGDNFAKIASGYEGLEVFDVDGTDYEEISCAMEKATSRAREKKGPSLIVAKVVRLGPHTISDDPSKYKSEAIILKEKEKDPFFKFERKVLEENIISKDEIENLKKEIILEIEESVKKAEKIPFPKKESILKNIYKDFDLPDNQVVDAEPEKESVVMVDALNHTLKEEMALDKGIIVYGQDVAKGKGGVFGVTRGLTDMFTESRCFNSPLAESTIIGTAIGLSLDGYHKPVVEIQFLDYLWTGINQLVNELSSYHYRSNGEWNCPIVVRIPYGGYIQGGPYHSQSIESVLTHIPGLKVVIPSNSSDAKRLLKTAIKDPNPVIFLEHKALYRQRVFCARKEPSSNEYLEFGRAKIVKEGSDITFIGWGMMIVMGYEIAEKLKDDNISVEVVDLRTLSPLDMDTIINSVKKTGKVVIAHEAAKTCGFGAELVAQINERAFKYLEAPIKRVCGLDCPISYCKDLEDAALPQKEDLEEAIKQLYFF
jgi:2-oxoisovalerate dehydrogenase E1 component